MAKRRFVCWGGPCCGRTATIDTNRETHMIPRPGGGFAPYQLEEVSVGRRRRSKIMLTWKPRVPREQYEERFGENHED